MANEISIKVDGLDKLQKKLGQMNQELQQTVQAAGKEAANEILNTQGLRKYPPVGPGNRPPVPYYVRGKGTQTWRGNDGKSERYGTQFYVANKEPYKTTIGNRASYAPYLGGNPNAPKMARLGWRSLYAVAEEKIPQITAIFQAWVNRLIRKVGL